MAKSMLGPMFWHAVRRCVCRCVCRCMYDELVQPCTKALVQIMHVYVCMYFYDIFDSHVEMHRHRDRETQRSLA